MSADSTNGVRAAVSKPQKPDPQRIAQQWLTCPGLIGSSLAEVARASRHSACTMRSERSKGLAWRKPRRSDGVEQARHGLRGSRLT